MQAAFQGCGGTGLGEIWVARRSVVTYGVECASDTLGEAGCDSQEANEESLKDEGEIDEITGRHRRKLEGM